ncbi:hypothetical protein D3C75_1193130 [compost metagenome]
MPVFFLRPGPQVFLGAAERMGGYLKYAAAALNRYFGIVHNLPGCYPGQGVMGDNDCCYLNGIPLAGGGFNLADSVIQT